MCVCPGQGGGGRDLRRTSQNSEIDSSKSKRERGDRYKGDEGVTFL